MKRYYSLSGIITSCTFALLMMQPLLSKKNGRCAFEPHMEKITIASTSFTSNKKIPSRFAKCNGKNISPQLSWSKLPAGTKSIVIIAQDPDAPSPKNPQKNPWVHWVVYDLPPHLLKIEEGTSITLLGGKEGVNDAGSIGYYGPCPAPGSGKHRYFFKVKALAIESLGLPSGATKKQVIDAMSNCIIGSGELIGTYEIS